MEQAIQTAGLVKRFGDVQAVDDGLVFLQRAANLDVVDCRPIIPLAEAEVVPSEPAGAGVNAMVTETN